MNIIEFLGVRIAEDIADPLTPRMLAEAKAKRRIFDECTIGITNRDKRFSAEERRTVPEWRIISIMAEVYANHPDYDESWRPWDGSSGGSYIAGT